MLRLLLFPLLLFCLACSRVHPINPATGQPLVQDTESLSHVEKLALQEEIIKRQQQEKIQQKHELLEVERQEHYNMLSERFRKN